MTMPDDPGARADRNTDSDVKGNAEMETHDWAERRSLRLETAEQVRTLIERLVSSEASNEQLRTVRTTLDALLDRLPPPKRSSRFDLDPLDESGIAPDTDVVVGAMNPLASPYEIVRAGDPFVMTSRFGIGYEGAPERVHGGHIFTGCDYAMGRAAALTGRTAVTGTIELRFHRAIRLHEKVRLEARVESIDGRKITTVARVTAEDELAAEARAIFIALDDASVTPA
jgi:Thioesterase superfamily